MNISAGLTYISGFKDCRSLEEIHLPDTITTIYENAFSDCINLSGINLPSSIRSVGAGAFDNTAWLNDQPSGLIYINNTLYAYKGAPEYEDVVIKEGTTRIVPGAFSSSHYLKSIVIPGSVQVIANEFRGSGIQSVVLGEGITEIGSDAFRDCDSLESIQLPESLTSIGDFAFYDCNALKEVIFPKKLNRLGKNSFSNCISLCNVAFDCGVTEINESAFSNCTSLETIQLPTGIVSIDYGAFNECQSLKEIIIPDGVKTIGSFAFAGCTSLKTVVIGKEVTDIGYGAFMYCSSLVTINIPDGITELHSHYTKYSWYGQPYEYDYGIFQNCTSLESITIPDGIQKIEAKTFYNTALTSITIKNPDAELGFKAFGVVNTVYGDAPIEDFIVYGYKGSTAEQYAKEYQLRFEELSEEEYLGDVDGDGTVSVIDATTIQKKLASLPTKAYNEKAADTDGDGSVSILDATGIQKHLASLPCPEGIGKPIT